MSNVANKIVSINAAGRERGPGLRIVNDCRQQLGESLCRWITGIRTPISEELFLLADGTRERKLQTRYLDLRHEVEQHWNRFVDAFRNGLADAGSQATASADALEVPDFDGLQLVDDGELAERIVIREFSAQLQESCDEQLYPLDRRIAALLGHEEPVAGENPLAPAIICQALASASSDLGLDTENRLLLLRRIERHLHLALPAIYQEINAELVERGILPDVRRSYRRSNTPAAPAANPAASPASVALDAAAEQLAAPTDLIAAMQRLAASRAQATGTAFQPPAAFADAAPMAGGAPAPIDAAAISQSFLASLNEAQHMEWTPSAGMLVNQVRWIGESEAGRQVSPIEAVTIDIVAMLFDFVFNDDELPATLKSLIGQLQIPVLKVAMLDHSFFANRQHPARRFLDGITGVALHWGASAEEGDPFFLRLEGFVKRIQQEFETNVEIFGEAIADLESFVSAHEAEETATIEIAADAVIRREAEEAAAERTRAALEPLLAKPQPESVREFLREHWSAVLRQKALVTDGDSPGWQDTVEVAEQLIWSVSPKSEAEERSRLIGMLPMLLARINAGLAITGIDDESRAGFFDTLVALHAAALKGSINEAATKPAEATKEIPIAAEGDLLVTRSVEDGVVIEEVMLVGASPMRRVRDREALEQANALKRGDWVDFIDDEGKVARERLNWISPQRGILVFSNHRAARAISISPEALARQIRDGAARIVREGSVFDRAIDGVMHSLGAA